jgi:hypothetical protein
MKRVYGANGINAFNSISEVLLLVTLEILFDYLLLDVLDITTEVGESELRWLYFKVVGINAGFRWLETILLIKLHFEISGDHQVLEKFAILIVEIEKIFQD